MTAIIYDRIKLRAELKRDEGLKLRVYLDSKRIPSIGVGRNLNAIGIRASETARLGITKASVLAHGITEAQAYVLLDNDIDEAEHALDRDWPWWRKLDGVRQRALINMMFNMGPATMRQFRNSLTLIQNGRYALAAKNLSVSAWDAQVGARADRLQAMILTGRA